MGVFGSSVYGIRMGTVAVVFCIAGLLSTALGDVYLHNPRGSNNRLFENSRNRNNANRLFDSQNNDRGGYNAGNVYYYVNSELGIEWTNQHSCADQNNHCEIILQYMCSDLLRDGVSQSTIPEKPSQCKNGDCNKDIRYGMHEDFYYYARCKLRERNKGLFSADKNLKESAKYTRQNQGGTRRGYECPEERDYYPYWEPTPWKDIAVMTNDPSRCEYYQSESQNVKSRFYCKVPYQHLYLNADKNNVEDYIPIEKEKCEAFEADGPDGTKVRGVWTEYKSHGLPPPDCGNTIPSRDNHLGNTFGGLHADYNWTVFDDPNTACVIRIRYNISTDDFEPWNTTAAHNNRNAKPTIGPDIWTALGLTTEDAKTRNYYLKPNPQVDVMNLNERKKNFRLQLAVNTAQYGRTFQDRTHLFSIKSRPAELQGKRIHNVGVRGKRGNIVQVYPAVEYDYTPQVLRASTNDYVHFQWTGSNDNNKGNDGQGEAGTDRSNIVPMSVRTFPEGDPTKAQKDIYGHAGVSYPANVLSSPFLGFSNETKKNLACLCNVQFGGDMIELDDSGTYYDLTPQKITMRGDFNYMCTRNNNFSNRSQKGKIVARDSSSRGKHIGSLGGNVTITGSEDPNQTGASVPPGALSSPQKVVLEVYADDEIPLETRPPNQDYVSYFVHLSQNVEVPSETPIIMTIQLKSGTAIGTLFEPSVYRTKDDQTWIGLAVDETSDSVVRFKTESGGHFVVAKSVAPGPMAGLVIGLLVAVILIVVLVFYCRTSKLPLLGYSSKV